MLQHSVVLTWLKTNWFGKNVWLIFIEMCASRWKLDGGLIFAGAELLWAIVFKYHYQNWEFELGLEVQAIHNAAPQPVLHPVQQPHVGVELLWLPRAAVQGTPMWHTHLYTHFVCEWSDRKWVGNSVHLTSGQVKLNINSKLLGERFSLWEVPMHRSAAAEGSRQLLYYETPKCLSLIWLLSSNEPSYSRSNISSLILSLFVLSASFVSK